MSEELIYTTRREFLAGTITTVSLAATMPGFLCRSAQAVAARAPSTGRVLVVLQLAGGNDGLNTVVPHGLDGYYRARPHLAIKPDECLKINDQVGLHPALAGLKDLYDDGKVAIIQGVGYPNPNRSHFASMDIWHTADPTGRRHSGWLGSYFDHCCKGSDPPPPKSAIALMAESPLALSGNKFTPLAFESPKTLTWRARGAPKGAKKVFDALNDNAPASPPHRGVSDKLDFVRRAALQARMGASEIRAAAKGLGAANGGGPGKKLENQLALVARMIAAGFETSVYYVSLGGFDTHSNQLGRQQQLLGQLGAAVKSFVGTLSKHKLLDRVLLMTFSEFGRRVQPNASGGTDHGAAAPMFVIGSKLKPGLHFQHPSLGNLQRGDLVQQCDFRRVYAAVIGDWLGGRVAHVLPGSHRAIDLIRT